MLRIAAGKIVWVGRATVFLVGLAVILALVVGVTSTALGADGRAFLLGKTNLATTVSTLVKQGTGPALSLRVDSGPPLAVNSSGKVTNLNADTLDGKDSSELAATTPQAEPWHEVGTAGASPFESGFYNAPAIHPSYGTAGFNTVGYFKDLSGVVHLKGMARTESASVDPNRSFSTVFTLPAGYRPAATEVQDQTTGRYVLIQPNGKVEIEVWENSEETPGIWQGGVALDGVTFRANN